MTGPRALSCPACGGLLDFREGDVEGSCRHCGTRVRRTDAVVRLLRPSAMDGTGALRAVRRLLEGPSIRRGALSRARVARPRLFYVPFWHVSAQVTGFAFGLEPVWEEQELPVATDAEQGGDDMSVFGKTRTVRIRKGAKAVSREIRVFGSVNVSAADLEPLGIPSMGEDSQLSMTGLEIQRNELPEGLEVLDSRSSGEGVLVDPSMPLSQAVASADRYFGRLAGGSARALEQRWTWHAITCRRVRLVFYPLWVVDFQCGGSPYRVVLDGASGKVVRGILPGRRRDLNILASIVAALWAACLPFVLSSLDGGSALRGCGSVTLLTGAMLGLGTWKLMDMLDSVSRKGSDVVV